MDGTRKASAHDIVFQARAGSPELNCCSVNGARGFGMISDWALMASDRGLIVNWYGPCTMQTSIAGHQVTLRQETEYPRAERVRLIVETKRSVEFPLLLRIPHWSKTTRVAINGKPSESVQPGSYFEINRKWKRGDQIELDLDFSLHFWAGERECANKASIYRGPVLLAWDRRFTQMDSEKIPRLDARNLHAKVMEANGWFAPMLLVEVSAVDERRLRLCDFGSAGSGGSPYQSWLPVEDVSLTSFSRSNPLRSGRAI
jgi:DUF1680 family protein